MKEGAEDGDEVGSISSLPMEDCRSRRYSLEEKMVRELVGCKFRQWALEGREEWKREKGEARKGMSFVFAFRPATLETAEHQLFTREE